MQQRSSSSSPSTALIFSSLDEYVYIHGDKVFLPLFSLKNERGMERWESESKWTRRMREPRKWEEKKGFLVEMEEPSFFSSSCPTKKCLTNQR
jgi:hypothetical protein